MTGRGHGCWRRSGAVLRRLQPAFDALVARLWRADPAAGAAAGGLLLVVYAGLLGVDRWRFCRTPTGFIPPQDQGYFLAVIQLPPASSLARTDAVDAPGVGDRILATPGVKDTSRFAGFDGATFTNAPNAGVDLHYARSRSRSARRGA